VAGLPEACEINGCDSPAAAQNPAKTAGNPGECRTFPCAEPSRPTTGWGATEKPGPGLRLRQAVALPIYAAALLQLLLLPLGVCSGRRYQSVPQAAPRHYGRTHRRRRATWAIATVCFVLLLTTKIDTLWMILGAALVSLTASSIGLVAYL
jgi:hypothetical protein